MISEKQLAVNRLNAKLSTGPKTPEGKAIVARNAVKHGIFSQDIVAVGGDREHSAYARVLAGLRDSLKPEGLMEQSLVEKIAVDTWRLRRTVAYESAVLRHEMQYFQKQLAYDRQKEAGKITEYKRDLVPLEFLKYSDEVSEADLATQSALIARLSAPDCPYEAEDRALEFVYRTRVDEDRKRRWNEWHSLQPVLKLDKPMPLDWREKAKACLTALNAAQRGRVRSELRQHEERILGEMKEVLAVRQAMETCGPLRYIPPEADLARIVKYETMLHRNIKRNMDMLHKLQAPRAKRR